MPDKDPPGQRPAVPRVDEAAADMGTLEQMGVVEAQPKPEPPPGPVPPVEETENTALLDAALTDAGVTKSPADQAAVATLARLDPATVQTIAAWVKHGKKPDGK